jgi:hypothetical protein
MPTFKSAPQLFSESSKAVRRNLSLFLLLSILSILDAAWQTGLALRDKAHGSAWDMVVKNSLFGNGSSYPSWGGGTIIFILFIVAVVLSLMMVILQVRAAHMQQVRFSQVWADFKKMWLRILGVEILSGMLILASLIAFIVPFFFVFPRLIFAPYLLVDQNCGVADAIDRSWKLTKGHYGVIYSLLFLGLVLGLANIIPIIGPVLGFALTMLYSVAGPMRYLELKKAK